MRRGQFLESQIDKLINYTNACGYLAAKLYPKRLADGTYIEGEKFDYIFILPGQVIVFDAKESKGKTWPFAKKDMEQADNLKKCKNAGCDAFFLVYFSELKKLIKFDIDKFIEALSYNKKHLKPEQGEEWDWTIIKNLSAGRSTS